jgi:hypothetical protein
MAGDIFVMEPDEVRTEADAWLISAAPELLAACKALVTGCNRFDGPTMAEIEDAQKVIAKAEAKAEGKS